MNLILGFEILIGGVATDAEQTPVLRDDTLAWGVRRTDTGEVLVPAAADPLTQYTRVGTGAYQYTLADAVPGVTYEYAFEAVVGGTTYHGVKVMTAPPDISGDSYLTVDEADALAATLPPSTPGLAQYNAADASGRAALLLLATVDVDRAGPYQGRKYDPTQALEFPRIPYGVAAVGAWPTVGWPMYDPLLPPPASQLASAVWDWDASANGGQGAVVVPKRVQLATLLQACDLAAGERQDRIQAIADGLAAQSDGPLSETYRPDAAPAVLCERAAGVMSFYRLRQGEAL